MTAHTKNAIAALDSLRLPELQARYLEVVGTETRCPNRQFLVRKISEALVANDARSSSVVSALPEESEQQVPDEDDDHISETPEDGDDSAGPLDEDGDDTLGDGEGADGTESLDGADEVDSDVVLEVGGAEARDSRAADVVELLDESDIVTVGPAAVEPGQQTEFITATTQVRGRYRGMTVEELQTKYEEVVGRRSSSQSVEYLRWKIREAEKGRVRVGPLDGRRATGVPLDVKVLPLRIEAGLLQRIDSAWRIRGLRSRMEFLRLAIGNYLEAIDVQSATESD